MDKITTPLQARRVMRRRIRELEAARQRHREAAGRVLDYGGQGAISEMVVAMLAEARARKRVGITPESRQASRNALKLKSCLVPKVGLSRHLRSIPIRPDMARYRN